MILYAFYAWTQRRRQSDSAVMDMLVMDMLDNLYWKEGFDICRLVMVGAFVLSEC